MKSFLMLPKVLEEVKQMIRSLPAREIKKSVLHEEINKLASTTFPDPSQHSNHSLYVRTTATELSLIMNENDKVILEVFFLKF